MLTLTRTIIGLRNNPLYQWECRRRRRTRVVVLLAAAVLAGAAAWARHQAWPEQLPWAAAVFLPFPLFVLPGIACAVTAALAASRRRRSGAWEALLLTPLTVEEIAAAIVAPVFLDAAILMVVLLLGLWGAGLYGITADALTWWVAATLPGLAAGACLGLAAGVWCRVRIQAAALAVVISFLVLSVVALPALPRLSIVFFWWGDQPLSFYAERITWALAALAGAEHVALATVRGVPDAGRALRWLLGLAPLCLAGIVILAGTTLCIHRVTRPGPIDVPFHSAAWRAALRDRGPLPSLEPDDEPLRMAADLMQNHLRTGMRCADAFALLGKSPAGGGSNSEETGCYPLVVEPGLDEEIEAWLRYRMTDPTLVVEFEGAPAAMVRDRYGVERWQPNPDWRLVSMRIEPGR